MLVEHMAAGIRSRFDRIALASRQAFGHPSGARRPPDRPGPTLTDQPASDGPDAIPDAPSAFVSYSRRDSAFVRRLVDALTERDITVWLDEEDIPPAARWR